MNALPLIDLPGALPAMPGLWIVAAALAMLLLVAIASAAGLTWRARSRGREEREAALGVFTAADVASAIANHEIEVHYQPVFSVEGSRLVGVEALLRWQHPRYGTIPARRFLRRAELEGSLPALGDLVLRSACVFARELQFFVPDLRVAVNVASSQLEDAGFPGIVKRALDMSGLAPTHLELEIPEQGARGSTRAATTITALAGLGVTLALDGYWAAPVGSGAALAGVRAVKLDLRANTWSEAAAGEIRRAAATARRAGLAVIAKRVESDHERSFQREIGCDFVQGNLYGKPLPGQAFRARVAGFMMATEPSPLAGAKAGAVR